MLTKIKTTMISPDFRVLLHYLSENLAQLIANTCRILTVKTVDIFPQNSPEILFKPPAYLL